MGCHDVKRIAIQGMQVTLLGLYTSCGILHGNEDNHFITCIPEHSRLETTKFVISTRHEGINECMNEQTNEWMDDNDDSSS